MKLILYILLLMGIITFCYGQSDTTGNKKNKILLKWAPTSLIGYSAIQFAGEIFYKPKKSVQLEYGIILPGTGLGRSDNRGHRIRIEQRNYLNWGNNLYFSPEIHFIFVRYNSTQRFSQNWETDSLTGERYALDGYLEDVGIKKYAFSGNFKIGFQYIFKKPKLLFDIYLGLGVRYVVTRFTSYPTIGEWVPPKDNWLDNYDYKESNRFAPNGVLGIKLGYQIK